MADPVAALFGRSTYASPVPGAGAARYAERRGRIATGRAAGAGSLPLAPELATRLTSSRLIVDFRNRLAHEYHNIDDEMVWAIAETDVPVLAGEVDGLLGEQAKD